MKGVEEVGKKRLKSEEGEKWIEAWFNQAWWIKGALQKQN